MKKKGIDVDMASRPAFGSASDPNEWVGVWEADEMEVPPEGRAPDLALERMRIDELKMDEEAGPSDSKRSEVICSTDSTSASGMWSKTDASPILMNSTLSRLQITRRVCQCLQAEISIT